MNEPRTIRTTIGAGSSGQLVALQEGKELPFTPRRVFWIAGVPEGGERANHANRDTRMVLVCAAGSCTVDVHDGSSWHHFVLDAPDRGLYCPAMTWKRIYAFSENAVLLAVCDTLYDAAEYIDDFETFLAGARRKGSS